MAYRKLNQHGLGGVGLFISLMLVIGVIGGVIWWTSKDNSGNNNSQPQTTAGSNSEEVVTNQDVETVNALAKPNCEGAYTKYIPDPTSSALNPKETGFVKDDVLFSDDGQFARTGAFCVYPEGGGGGVEVTLKKIDGTWTVINGSQETPGKAWGEQYGAPEGWYTTEY